MAEPSSRDTAGQDAAERLSRSPFTSSPLSLPPQVCAREVVHGFVNLGEVSVVELAGAKQRCKFRQQVDPLFHRAPVPLSLRRRSAGLELLSSPDQLAGDHVPRCIRVRGVSTSKLDGELLEKSVKSRVVV